MTNKNKIFNDPVHGFVTIPTSLIYDLIEHPIFQRLRRIKQLGLAHYVYPGALHTRFHHAIGAMHLMGRALEILSSKGFVITDEEKEAAQVAILLHDIGHGPFSHVLEHQILHKVNHESLSIIIMKALDKVFDGRLQLSIEMFEDKYHRPFFHQLISSQLDMDRLDYLQRDCFFTGVLEGTIGAERILKLMTLENDSLVFEQKGIYSIENFLTARRLMYWQVYLHKTTTSTEIMLIKILQRARQLLQNGTGLYANSFFKIFLLEQVSFEMFENEEKYLEAFLKIDDYDIWAVVKSWATCSDKILSSLCRMVLDRKLFKLKIMDEAPSTELIQQYKKDLQQKLKLTDEEMPYFFEIGATQNNAYQLNASQILIKTKSKEIKNIVEASDLENIRALTKIVKKYYVCWSQNVYL